MKYCGSIAFSWLRSRILLYSYWNKAIWLWGGKVPLPIIFNIFITIFHFYESLTLILYIFHLYIKMKFNPFIHSGLSWTKLFAKETTYILYMIYYIILSKRWTGIQPKLFINPINIITIHMKFLYNKFALFWGTCGLKTGCYYIAYLLFYGF